MTCLAVVTTIGTRTDARRLAKAMVERRLAACAQLEPIDSVYVWKGKLRREPEIRITFKTTARRYAELERAIRMLHPYEVPAIHAVALRLVSVPYGRWIMDNTKPK